MLTPVEFGIVVPARNESGHIERCLLSVNRAILESQARCSIVVVDDRSTDQTGEIARQMMEGRPGASVISPGPINVGNARALGVNFLAQDAAARPRWIVSTDADSEVPADWLTRLRTHDEAGFDAVAGIVAIKGHRSLKDAFEARYRRGITADGHSHVHGANLAIRLDVYDQVGGFMPVPCGEDQDLWNRVKLAGFRTVSDTALVVTTSARLRSRTRGGFATDLRSIHQDLLDERFAAT